MPLAVTYDAWKADQPDPGAGLEQCEECLTAMPDCDCPLCCEFSLTPVEWV